MMETKTCPTCGAELEQIERIRLKPAWAGGGQEVVRHVSPCEACERKAQEVQEGIMRDRHQRALIRDSRIPEAVWGLGLDPALWKQHRLVIDDGNRNAIEALRSWVQAERTGCLLMGTQGLGKSLLALCAGMDCLRSGQEVLWVAERELFDTFRGTRRNDPDAADLVGKAQRVEVLILDDFGSHQLDRGSRFMQELYLDLIDCRLPVVGPPLKTLVTSQHDPASLGAACGHQALASRLLALLGGNHLELKGSDRRRARWSLGKAGA
jgi:DNA replication protein DnaC